MRDILIFLYSAFLAVSCYAQDIDMDIIADIESGNNPLAHNVSSNARGVCQITPVCLKEYNQRFAIFITEEELYNSFINKKIGDWYMNQRIPEMLDHYKIEDNVDNRLKCYNWGIGNLRKGKKVPAETKNYIKKYHQKLEEKWKK